MTTGKVVYKTLNNLRSLHQDLSCHALDRNHQEIVNAFQDYADQLRQMEQHLANWIRQKEIDQYIQSELLYNHIIVQNPAGQ